MCKKFIPPKDMEFSFAFTPDECHRVLMGVCSLDKPFKSNSNKKITKDESDINYCQRLYNAMRDKVRLPLDISIDRGIKCGHYDFSDGRHRTCIAQKKGLEIYAEVLYNQNQFCDECKKKNPDNSRG